MSNTVSILVSADGRGAIRELNRVQGSLGRLDSVGTRTGQRLGHALGTVARAGAYALAGGVVAAGYGMVKAVESAATFQQQLNVLQAVSGATADQMRRISAESIALGKDIKLPATSAQDAAVAMTELTKAGLSVKDAMTSARSALQLATAGELETADAAKVMATSLNQFHLAGTQATKVADLLAGAANASAGDVIDFAEGLKYAGTAAHAAGQSITITIAALAEMANAGLQGSVAGASLSQALRSLQAPSSKAAAEIKRLGLSIYDAHGNMKPLDEIAQTFTQHLGDMTQQQQNATLGTIFGTRAIQAARIVFLGGKDALDKYADTVGKAGNAQRLTEARTKGFRGALAALKSNVETLGISIGLKLIPVATAAAKELSKVVDVIGKIASAKSPRIAIQIAWKGVGRLYDSLQDLLFGGINDAQSKLGGAASGVNAIAVPIAYDGIVQKLTGAISAGFNAVHWKDIGTRVADSFADGLRFTNAQAGALIKSLIDGVNANKAQIGTAAAAIALEFVSALLDPGFWKDNWKTILAIAISIFPVSDLTAFGGKIAVALFRPFLRVLPETMKTAIFAVETLFRTGFGRIAENILAHLRGTARIFPNLFQRGFRVVERVATTIFRAIVSRITSIFGIAAGTIEKEGTQAFHGVERAARTVGQRILGIIGNLGKFILKVGLVSAAIGLVQDAFNKVKQAVIDVIHWVENLAGKIGSLPSLPGLPGLPHIPGTASGGTTIRSGLQLVGERGPEILNMPRGAQVIPLSRTGGAVNLTVNMGLLELPTGAEYNRFMARFSRDLTPHLANVRTRRG
jgi:TP901 family phage tail tape measure protein